LEPSEDLAGALEAVEAGALPAVEAGLGAIAAEFVVFEGVEDEAVVVVAQRVTSELKESGQSFYVNALVCCCLCATRLC
jgi:hypothetical protein